MEEATRMHGSRNCCLDQVIKKVLIKVVAQAIMTYMISIFKIPDGLPR